MPPRSKRGDRILSDLNISIGSDSIFVGSLALGRSDLKYSNTNLSLRLNSVIDPVGSKFSESMS